MEQFVALVENTFDKIRFYMLSTCTPQDGINLKGGVYGVIKIPVGLLDKKHREAGRPTHPFG
jgi:hypothetical protein